MNVVALSPVISEDSEECARILRDLAKQAEQGKILAVAVATVGPSHEIVSQVHIGDNWCRLLGSVTALQHDILHNGDVPG